jgi:hypothetical protein
MRLLLIAAAAAGFIVASAAIAPAAQAEVLSIDVVGTGAEENPVVETSGIAKARFTYDTDTKELTYVVTISGISDNQVTAAHIHLGAAGTNGPVVYPLSAETFAITSGSISLTDEDVANLAAGDFYLNVHSTFAPGGFARAQIVFPGLTADAGASTGDVTPPSTGDAGLAGAASSTPWLALAGLAPLAGGTGLALARRRA